MAKEQILFTTTRDEDEIDEVDREIEQRRLLMYPKEALKIGGELDRLLILHEDFGNSLTAFDRLFQVAREFNIPQGGWLIGDPGTGHKTLYRQFESTLPKSTLFAPGFGCVRVTLRGAPSLGQLAASLFRRYDYPFHRGTETQLCNRWPIALELVQTKGTRLIYFHNAHCLVGYAGHTRSPGGLHYNRPVVDAICELMDETHVAVVLGGSELLDRLRELSPELESRLTVRMRLRTFDPDAQWRGLLKAFATRFVPVSLKFIDCDPEAKRLHQLTAGRIVHLKRLLVEAVLIAVQQKSAAIDRDIMRRAVDLVGGFAGLRANPYCAKPQNAAPVVPSA
jgi:hypothetical protein